MLWRKKTNSCACDSRLAQEAVSRGWDRVFPGLLWVCGCPSARHPGPFCPRPTRSRGLPTGWQQAVVHGCSLPSWLLLSPILQNSCISLFQSGSFCCFFRKWWCLLRRSGSLGKPGGHQCLRQWLRSLKEFILILLQEYNLSINPRYGKNIYYKNICLVWID